ncbi:MAG: hypothetical protein AB4040_17435 [Synechococcus sp.]
MYIQPLQAVDNPGCYHVGGDVSIHPSATIAPGALIHAEPNCKVSIGSAACIGMGVVIHACEGDVEVDSGVNLGAAVLIVGHASVGANACVGSSTTIRNSRVGSGEVVPPGSLIGALGKSTSPFSFSSQAVNNDNLSGNEERPVEDVSETDKCCRPSHLVGSAASGVSPLSTSTASDGLSPPDRKETFEESAPPPSVPNEPATALVSGPPVDLTGYNSIHKVVSPEEDAPDPDRVDSLEGSSPNESEKFVSNDAVGVRVASSTSSSPEQDSSELLTGESLVIPEKEQQIAPSPAFGKSQVHRLMKSLFPYSSNHGNGASSPDA